MSSPGQQAGALETDQPVTHNLAHVGQRALDSVPGGAAKLTVYAGRGQRRDGRAAYQLASTCCAGAA
jgi:hypothetical protein